MHQEVFYQESIVLLRCNSKMPVPILYHDSCMSLRAADKKYTIHDDDFIFSKHINK